MSDDGRQTLRDRVLPNTAAYRAVVGALVVLPTTGVVLWRWLQGDRLTPIMAVVFLTIVFAGVIAVFGRGTFRTAFDAMREVTGDGDGDDGE